MTNSWKLVLGLGTTVTSLALCAPAVHAQTNCNASVGPDIIVGDLQDIANYTGQNLSGVDYEAVAFGTYSCNIGSVWANWISNTNEHPVIDNNLYKYKLANGYSTFQHIGMSWLKHGFFALSNTLCCTGCSATDGTHLGVKCSDPYTASRNGGQSGAGPRWQVNAATGVFTYPPANPSWSGSVARRCRIRVSDLEASSANVRYFGEAQYVTHDDATAGNKNNNASYREVTCSGSGTAWTFALAASTVREQPAIQAWKAIDPNVTLSAIDIPGDGRVVLGYSVTNTAPGNWHYEYAIFNQTSDLSIGSFAVPVGSATITNIGFHDVEYHDGDGVGSVTRDGTDWSSSIVAGTLTWSTVTYASNNNGNGLMWGTMYNFRFDADQPPSASPVTLGTWKNAGSLVASAQAPNFSPGGAMVSFCDPATSGVMACPCANPALLPGQGCDNSSSTGGAKLTATGNASLVSDTVVFNVTGEKPTATSIVLQGDNVVAAGTQFGQGVRCVGGSLKRLYTKSAVGGAITAPQIGDSAVSARSAFLGDTIASGQHRFYQVYYRDPTVLGGCAASATFNVGQAYDVTWNP